MAYIDYNSGKIIGGKPVKVSDWSQKWKLALMILAMAGAAWWGWEAIGLLKVIAAK